MIAAGGVIAGSRKPLAFYAIDFDGLSDFISFGDVLGFEYTDAFTLSAWVNPRVLGGFAVVFAKREEAVGILRGWSIQVNSSGRFGGTKVHGTGQGLTFYSANNTISVNSWYHITAVFPANGVGPILLYCNGSLVSSTQTAGPVTATIETDAEARIGCMVDAMSPSALYTPYSGQIGPCGIWDRILTPLEIAELFGMKSNVDWTKHSASSDLIWCPRITASTDMEGTDSVIDYSSSGFDGTPVSMTAANKIAVLTSELL